MQDETAPTRPVRSLFRCVTARRSAHRLVSLVACLFFAALAVPAAAESLSHGRFRNVQIYRPAGTVKQVALFLSGDAGWDRGMAGMASQLAADGTLVVGIDVQKLFASLEADDDSCVFPDGDLENLSHFVQAYYKLPTYFTPLLVGYSSGATLAYATLAQAPHGIFGGALSLSFCAELDLGKPLCKAEALQYSMRNDGEGARLAPPVSLRAPWLVLQGATDEVCPAAEARQFVTQARSARYLELPNVGHDYRRAPGWMPQFKSAYASLLASGPPSLPAPPASLSDLPLIEVPADESASGQATDDGDLFAVLLSGDGGWAGLDKQVAAALSARGIPVAGVDSLRYFWKARTPAGLAGDIDRIVRFYANHWKKKRVLLIGYSQGADVLPFAVNRVPAATRQAIQLTALIGVSRTAAFEFHVSNWFGGSAGQPVKPETDKLSSSDTLCLYGEDDDDSLCPTIGADHAHVINLSGGHHFGGDYRKLAEVIIRHATRPAQPSGGR
jgi:type IV secretory pathway VirJ component